MSDRIFQENQYVTAYELCLIRHSQFTYIKYAMLPLLKVSVDSLKDHHLVFSCDRRWPAQGPIMTYIYEFEMRLFACNKSNTFFKSSQCSQMKSKHYQTFRIGQDWSPAPSRNVGEHARTVSQNVHLILRCLRQPF